MQHDGIKPELHTRALYRKSCGWVDRKTREHSSYTTMDLVSQQLASAKSSLESSISAFYSTIQPHIPVDVDHALKTYAHALTTTSKDEVLRDLSQFKVTAATATVSMTTVAILLLINRLFSLSAGSGTQPSKKKKKKKLTKAQRANKEIQAVLDFVEETYVKQIEEYFAGYESMTEENREYKYKYFEEMLLKELMKLDGIDTVGNDVLRENRKKVIKFIQQYQKKLDQFRSEHS